MKADSYFGYCLVKTQQQRLSHTKPGLQILHFEEKTQEQRTSQLEERTE